MKNKMLSQSVADSILCEKAIKNIVTDQWMIMEFLEQRMMSV